MLDCFIYNMRIYSLTHLKWTLIIALTYYVHNIASENKRSLPNTHHNIWLSLAAAHTHIIWYFNNAYLYAERSIEREERER